MVYSEKTRNKFIILKQYNRIKKDDMVFLNSVFLLSIFLASFISVFIYLKFQINYLPIIIFFPILLFISTFIIYTYYLLKAEDRGKKCEMLLPGFLEDISIKLRAGIILEKALMLSAEITKDPLKEEIITAARNISNGKDIISSLENMKTSILSKKFSETIDIIVLGIRKGGEIADLLSVIVESLESEFEIERELKTNVNTYVIFIGMALIVGMPALFAISNILSEVLNTQIAGLDIESIGNTIPIEIAKDTSKSKESMLIFSLSLITLSSVMGSFVLSLVKGKHERDGLRYMPFLAIGSISMFFLALNTIKMLASSIV